MKVVHDGEQPGAQYRFRPITIGGASGVPTQNQWYPFLQANNICAQYMIIQHVSTDGLNKTIEVQITADGTTVTASASLISGTTYCVYLNPGLTDSLVYQAAVIQMGYGTPFYARSFTSEIRTTGTNPQTLSGTTRWWQL